MKISVKWFGDQFNVGLASAAGKDDFISIKGVRIKSSDKGEFLSWPAQKKDDGTWWRHVWSSDEFQSAVIAEARKSQPKPAARKPAEEFDDPPF